ncbi:MAG: IcmT/TraK family protein, partial [Candidatus Competibacter sp.]
MEDLHRLLLWATDQAVSDVTFQAHQPVVVERYGRLFPVTRRRLALAEVYHLTQVIYGDNAPSQLAGGQDIDCSYEIPRGRADLARYRVNMTAVRAGRERGVEITARTIATTPPPLDHLDLPPDLRASLVFEQGLVLITGPTGSGKTTLLAAIIRHLLEDPHAHRKILTYEAPIEYVYDFVPRVHASIAQHEIGVHLPSFAAGVRNSLRRKPMVILVGEARDAETITAVVDAAMTGHLVYTTSHTNSVPETLRRLVSAFPADGRDGRLADLLEALANHRDPAPGADHRRPAGGRARIPPFHPGPQGRHSGATAGAGGRGHSPPGARARPPLDRRSGRPAGGRADRRAGVPAVPGARHPGRGDLPPAAGGSRSPRTRRSRWPRMNTRWRKRRGATPPCRPCSGVIEAHAALPIVLWLVHISWPTFVLAVAAIAGLTVVRYLGFDARSAYRTGQCFLIRA